MVTKWQILMVLIQQNVRMSFECVVETVMLSSHKILYCNHTHLFVDKENYVNYYKSSISS